MLLVLHTLPVHLHSTSSWLNRSKSPCVFVHLYPFQKYLSTIKWVLCSTFADWSVLHLNVKWLYLFTKFYLNTFAQWEREEASSHSHHWHEWGIDYYQRSGRQRWRAQEVCFWLFVLVTWRVQRKVWWVPRTNRLKIRRSGNRIWSRNLVYTVYEYMRMLEDWLNFF